MILFWITFLLKTDKRGYWERLRGEEQASRILISERKEREITKIKKKDAKQDKKRKKKEAKREVRITDNVK